MRRSLDLGAIIDQVAIAVVVVDRDHNVVEWNRQVVAWTGIRAEDAVRRPLKSLMPRHGRSLERKLRYVFRVGATGFLSHEIYEHMVPVALPGYIAPDVGEMYQDCTIAPVMGADGEVELAVLSISDVTDRVRYKHASDEARRTLEIRNRTDALTGIANRGYFQARLERALASGPSERPVSLVLFDVDHFKRLNDRHGHLAGDAVLVELAARCKAAVRDDDVLARYGGEEFAVIVRAPLVKAMEVAERLRRCLADAPIGFGDLRLEVTASFGVTEANADDDVDSLIHRTDSALYFAKHGGRNRVETSAGPVVSLQVA